jgi:ubiquinone/menaquinone biosynthesis C-methylase UbiE
MKINFKETTKDLLTRIDIHNKYGSKNIDDWMLHILPLKPGIKILDVACGSGKQCFSYYKHLSGIADITGGDVSVDLLGQAKLENQAYNNAVKFLEINFNKQIPFLDKSFDLVSCCFAIYYAENIPFTIKEMHRVLKPGGHIFTSGPMPDNKRLFYDIIREATNKPIPPMPGSSRYSTEIYSAIQENFPKVETLVFENPLIFKQIDPFMAYTRASISEDRKLWGNFFDDREEFEQIMQQISNVANKWLQRDGQLVMTKVVGGFLAEK